MMNTAANKLGFRAEIKVAALLIGYGHRVSRMRLKEKFDLLVNGRIRVEVKAATRGADGRWHVNISRRGVLNETTVDLYIVRLDGIPGFKLPLHLLFNSPLRRKAFNFTLRSLLLKYGANAVAFEKFRGRKKAGKIVKK